jgi:hypothetical protein
MDHSCSNRRPSAANYYTQRHAANRPDEKLLLINMGARDSQGGKLQGLKRAADEQTTQFHGGENNQGLEQRIVDESARHGERLVKPEEQGHAHRRNGLKPIDGHNADENSQEYSSGSVAWVKPLFQQGG